MSQQIASGSIFAARAGVGPTNTELVVDPSGAVIFNVGTPSVNTVPIYPSLLGSYSSLPGTGVTSLSKNSDASVQLNNWLSTYLIDSPPAVTALTSSVSTAGIQLSFSLPAQKRLAFSSTAVPYIQTVRADVVRSSLNTLGNWADASAVTLTLETVSGNAYASATNLSLLVDVGVNVLSSGTYSAFASILPVTSYDIRVYCKNQSDASQRYVTALGLQSLPVGTPVAPTNLLATATSTTSIATTWTAPVDNDTNTAGNQLTPFIAQYRVTKNASSSVRYGGVVTDNAAVTTTLTSGSNSATALALTALHPGTSYNLTVAALNAINPVYSSESTPITVALTPLPTAPAYLAPADVTSLYNVASLLGTYNAAGGYSLDGTTVAVPILASSAISDTTLRTTAMPARRTNFVAGATGTVGALTAFAGPTSTYTTAANTSTFNTQGLGVTSVSGALTNGCARINYSGDADYYAGGSVDTQGFYKTISAFTSGASVATNFPGSAGQYSLQLQYAPVGGVTTRSSQIMFYVSDAAIATSINTLGMTAETAGAVAQISGVPTFTSSAVFRTQFSQAEIAHYFLRADKTHANLQITTSTGTALSAVNTVSQASIGASHKYYVTGAQKYATSSVLASGTGLVLPATSTPAEVQFSDFSVPLTAATSVYDEALVIKATPYSLYSDNGGAVATGAYLSTTDGSTLALRIDTVSVNANRSAASFASTNKGQQVTSGTGTYPSTFGTAYDHTASILTTSDLQLLNGAFVTPAFIGGAYKSYTGYYTSGALAKPDYSSIVSSTSYRYVSFYFTGAITSSSYTNIRLNIVQSGLTVNLQSINSANHSVQLRVIDPVGGKGTGWLDATNAVLGTGIGSGADGTSCIAPAYSSASQRDCIILAGTGSTASFVVRVGIPLNVAASVTSVTLTPVVAFT